MQYELVQDASTWLINFIAIAGIAMFVLLFIHAYWTCYRHQQAYTKELPQQVKQDLQEIKQEPEEFYQDKSHQTSLSAVFDLEAKRRPFWYSIG